MKVGRDRNAPHPARAAAWRAVKLAAQHGRRLTSRLALHAGDQELLHRTGSRQRRFGDGRP